MNSSPLDHWEVPNGYYVLSAAWAFPIFLLVAGGLLLFAGAYCNGQGCENMNFRTPKSGTVVLGVVAGSAAWAIGTVIFAVFMRPIWRFFISPNSRARDSLPKSSLFASPFVILGTSFLVLGGLAISTDSGRLLETVMSFKWLAFGVVLGAIGSLCGLACSFLVRPKVPQI